MSREAMKLALEALETVAADVKTTPTAYEAQRQAITALREALVNEALDKKAENARELGLDYEPIQCPICKAEDSPYPKCGCVTYVEQPAQQEPVAWKLVPREPTHEMLKAMDECSTEGYDERLYAGHASSVYMAAVDAAPTPPAQRKPLADEEIKELYGDDDNFRMTKKYVVAFARAIEAAHNIKENT